MALNNYFQISKKRPQPKLWLCKPNYSRIDRLKEISNINGNFKYNNLNQLTFTIPTEVFNEGNHEQQRNELLDTVRNKYVIEFQNINFKDYFVIDEVKKISGDSDKIEIVANSVASELNKKSVNEIKFLASTIKQIMDSTLSSYAPLWTLDYVDPKIENVKRELEMQQSTVTSVVDQINTLFDSVVVFNSVNRTISFYHKDNAGINRGLRVRENSYLKSFEDSLVSTDVITRLYPIGKEGLSINSVNPAGTDYIEDFSYFIKPFERDENRNVIQHSNYMSDELCHALLDYQELYKSKVEEGKDITERYTNLLKDWTTQDLKLRELEAIKVRLEDRVELLKPKNEYVEYGNIKKNTSLSLDKSSYYLIMIKNYGSLARIKVKGVAQDVKANDWTYIKVDTDDFMDATKYKEKAIVPIEIVSANSSLDMTVTRSSKADFEDMEIKDLEKKYNYIKYREEYASQFSIVNALNKRLKDIEQEKVNLIDQLRPEKYLTPKLYNERELYVMSGVWQEENHTVAQELYDDAIKQLGQKNNSSRSVSIGLVNFTQSLEHEEDWDKLNAGEVLVFSNKVFGEKLKAYITDLNISFEDNQVQVTISDVFDFKDVSQRISETLATATSSATQINFQKEQIRNARNDISKILEIVNGKIDTRKQIITAGGETIELNSKGIMNMEVGNREAYIIQNNGVISATRNNGNSHVVLADTRGLNAESIKGSMTLSNDTRIRNADGSIYIDDEGIFVTENKFNIISKDGLNTLEQLRNEQQEKIQELSKIYDQKLNQLVDESADVEKTIGETASYLVEAFKDDFITEFEQRKIEEHLAQLDKENKEYEGQIEMALKHPYIHPEDYIELSDAYNTYQGMYETLVGTIVESINDKKITEKESQAVNESVIAFREEVKDILLLVQQVLESTRNTQIDSKVQKVVDYSTRIQEDMQDEMADLEESIKNINDNIREAIGDGVFTLAEIEIIKNNLLIMTSENRDVANRHESIVTNPNLPVANADSLKLVYKSYNDKFNELVNHINEMMEDKQADEEEIQTYQVLFNQLSDTKKDYLTAYSNAILIIAKAYSEDARSQALGAIESLKDEYTNDLKDLSQSITDYKTDITQAFSDGIITSTEKGRLKTHQEIIAREKRDLDKNFSDLYNNPLLIETSKEELNNTKNAFNVAFEDINNKINEIIKDNVVNDLESEQAKQSLTEYDIAYSNYTNAIQKAINSLSKSIADKTASDKVNAFSGVLTSIQGDISSIQKQVDGAIETWYYNYDPTLSNMPASQWTTNEIKNAHVGDFFLNNKTGNAYRFTLTDSTYAWTLLTDQAIADALKNAKDAKDTADGKRRVFVDTPKTPYDVGDMWVQGASGDIMVCTIAKLSNQVYSASDWAKASKYTDDELAKQALNLAKTTKQNFDSFSASIVKDFNDGIITEAEMTRLKTHLDIIEKDYIDLTTNVADLSKADELSSELKIELSSNETKYKADYKVLKESVISYIEDKKITQLEKDNTNTYLKNYFTSLSNLTLMIQKCLKNISETIASNKANEAMNNATNAWNQKLNSELSALRNTDSFPSSAIKVEALLVDKLMSQAQLTEKLVANNAFVNNFMSNTIVTKKIQSTDIEAIRLRAVDKGSSVNIEKGSLTFNKSDGSRIDLSIEKGLNMYDSTGKQVLGLDKTFAKVSALGTTGGNVYLAANLGYEVRTVDITKIPSDGAAGSYEYVPIRTLGIRSRPGDVLPIGSDYGVYITSNNLIEGGNLSFKPISADGFFGNFMEINSLTTGVNLYIRPSKGGEVRITTAGTTGDYRPIRASAFTPGSYYQYKEDITKWDYDALSVIKSEFQAYQYKLINDENGKLRRGVIVGGNYETITEFIDNDGVDLYEMTTWALRGIQQLANKVEILEEKLNETR